MADTQGTGSASSTPSEEQPKGQVQQPAAPQEPAKPEQPKVEQQIETDNKRTQEQFEKLLDNNKKLFEANELLRSELSRRALANQQFAPIQQPPIQQTTATSQQVNPADFVEVDPSTGDRYINDAKLKAAVEELNTRATRAEEAVQKYIQTSENREIERQNKEAFGSYPNLNPAGSGFDVTFHNQTRAVIYDSLINPQDYGGKPLSFKDAADFVHRSMNKTDTGEKNQQASASEIPQSQNAAETNRVTDELKQQAAASPAGETPQMRQAPEGAEELSRLQMQTRLGSTEAIAKRLLNIDHLVKKEEGAS